MTQFDWMDFFPSAQSFGERVNTVMRSLPVCRREAEVGLLHLTPSLDEAAMARQLGCSAATVHEWRRRLRAKLHAHDELTVGLIILSALWRSTTSGDLKASR
jgi:DNA-binding NarL/FixJ family response regulator